MRKIPLVAIVGLMCALTLQAGPADAWTGTVTLTPTKVYQGDSTTFKLELFNSGTRTLHVNWITAVFCWTDIGYRVDFKEDDGSSEAISGRSSHTFTAATSIPQHETGSCAVVIDVNGYWSNESSTTTNTYQASININEPLVNSGVWMAMIAIVTFLIIVIVIEAVLVTMLVLHRRSPGLHQPPARPPYPGYQQGPPPYEQQQQSYQMPRPGQPPSGPPPS